MIDNFDLKIGPKFFPMKKPRLEDALNPINLNKINKI